MAWHLDRKVPVAIILTLISQLIGFGWISSKLDSRVEGLEQFKVATVSAKIDTRVSSLENIAARHDRSIDVLVDGREALKERLARLEEAQRHSLDVLLRIERQIVKK